MATASILAVRPDSVGQTRNARRSRGWRCRTTRPCAPAASGRETVKGLRHAIVSEWHEQGDTVLELGITYDRLDGKQVTIPVVTIYHRRDDGLIDDYRVFFDLAPVFA
jgi:hypothetical protein